MEGMRERELGHQQEQGIAVQIPGDSIQPYPARTVEDEEMEVKGKDDGAHFEEEIFMCESSFETNE
jgi:hypothetical protein